MYVYTVCRSSHAEPKSMILMIGLSRLCPSSAYGSSSSSSSRTTYFFKRMFSGFKSQCISFALLSRHSPFSSCCAKTRTKVVLNPRN